MQTISKREEVLIDIYINVSGIAEGRGLVFLKLKINESLRFIR